MFLKLTILNIVRNSSHFIDVLCLNIYPCLCYLPCMEFAFKRKSTISVFVFILQKYQGEGSIVIYCNTIFNIAIYRDTIFQSQYPALL